MFRPLRHLLAPLAAIALMAPAVGAITQEEREKHLDIVNALDEVGVSLYVNSKELCEIGMGYYYGAYIPAQKSIVICQQGQELNGIPVNFSEEDLDTLRHETHHLVQDCVDGKLDGYLRPLFDEEEFIDFLQDYPVSKLQQIREMYARNGHTDYEIRLEQEAFVVADYILPEVMASAVRRMCGSAER